MFAALSGPLAQIGVALELNPVAFLMTLVVGADIWFMPHEVATLMVVFSFGLISMSDFIKLATLKSIIGFAVFLAIQIPYWFLVEMCIRDSIDRQSGRDAIPAAGRSRCFAPAHRLCLAG